MWLFQIGKGEILAEGKEIAFLGYGEVVQRCLIARSLLSNFGIQATVANARFCKPLDIDLIRTLCQHHSFLITVEEGTVGGFGSHVSQFISLDGLLDGRTKVKVLTFTSLFVSSLGSMKHILYSCNAVTHFSLLELLSGSNFTSALHMLCFFHVAS
jgi:deoxyxylulose-5-phosphate synthase